LRNETLHGNNKQFVMKNWEAKELMLLYFNNLFKYKDKRI